MLQCSMLRPTCEASRVGPRAKMEAALHQHGHHPQVLAKFVEDCRVKALMGSCPRSHSSFLSAVGSWILFAGRFLDKKARIVTCIAALCSLALAC